MPKAIDLEEALLATWRTCHRVTVFLVENLPEEIWREKPPAGGGRTLAEIVAHVNNCRLMWGKMLGKKVGIALPARLNRRTVTREQAVAALEESAQVITDLLELGLSRGGKLAGFPPDVVHFLAYFVAHEGHHRGQMALLCRLLGHRLPPEVGYGQWQWSKRAREASIR